MSPLVIGRRGSRLQLLDGQFFAVSTVIAVTEGSIEHNSASATADHF